MRQSKIEVYLHMVWATKNRNPLIVPEIERAIHRCIEQQARDLRCTVLAINGMPDHVHLLLKVPSTITIAQIAHKVKGVSSGMANDRWPEREYFDWQDGYCAKSVSPAHVGRVVAYVENQKQHHAANTLTPALEETDEEYIPPIEIQSDRKYAVAPAGRLAVRPLDGSFMARTLSR